MKKLQLIIIFVLIILPIAHAEIKDFLYDGKEVYVHVKKNHVTTVIFPEPINGVIRGFAADSYVVQRNDKKPNSLELMPTDSEVAEMTVSGVSGEDYILRFIAKDDFYTKLTIRRMAATVDKNENKTMTAKMDILPETSNLPPELNLRVTLKGNELPLKIYLSTISQLTGYNVITTPDIDSQRTSINLENIEVSTAVLNPYITLKYVIKT